MKKRRKRPSLTERRKQYLWCLCLATTGRPDPPYLLVANMHPRNTLATLAKANGWQHRVLKTKRGQVGIMFDGVMTAERLRDGLDEFQRYVEGVAQNMREELNAEIDAARTLNS